MFTASRLPAPAALASTAAVNFEIANIAISFRDIFTRKLPSAHRYNLLIISYTLVGKFFLKLI